MRLKLVNLLFLALVGSQAFGQFRSMSSEGNGDTFTMTFRGGLLSSYGNPVTGNPYSAEQVSEHVQTLADGTHISQPRSVEKVWRDSQGRTRTERPMMRGPNGEAWTTLPEIRDPVGGFYYLIDDQNQTVHRVALPAPQEPRKVSVPAATQAAKVSTVPRYRSEFSSEDLGTQTIEGVIAQGRRSTNTLPVNAVGNDRPITTTNEIWTSKELGGMVVLSKNSDPRNGENTMRFTNISRAEPDPSLFQPPAGYTIVDEKDEFKITLKRPSN